MVKLLFVRRYQNQVNLERFRTSNFKFFFNHDEIMIVRKDQNQPNNNMELFRPSNFKTKYNHSEVIEKSLRQMTRILV